MLRRQTILDGCNDQVEIGGDVGTEIVEDGEIGAAEDKTSAVKVDNEREFVVGGGGSQGGCGQVKTEPGVV